MARTSVRLSLIIALLVTAAGLLARPASAQAVNLWSHRIVGTPPTVDGAVGATEWPWAPQITIDPSYVNPDPYGSMPPDAPAYATFAYTDSDLYILVDVVGDTTADASDECLFWIRPGSVTNVVEVSGDGSSDALGGDRAAGFGTSPNAPSTNHRIYEFRIPLSALGVTVGQTVGLCSPFFKSSPSMGYDPSTGRDNIWPPGLDPNNLATWGALTLKDPADAIPALSPWGMALLALLIGILATAAARRTLP
jgi:hypothetical protein